jgi:geranylgeranyl diphosphate synthase type II
VKRAPDSDLPGDLANARREVNARLRALLAGQAGVPPRLRRAMAHSLFAGGKRLRPILLLWTYEAVRGARGRAPRTSRSRALDAACALEMLHTYSLIHDDLPAMDDDVLRRGRPTCHVAFDEATAILAGDGLQGLAFTVLGRCLVPAGPLVEMIGTAVGPSGMVGGQQRDLLAEGRRVGAGSIRRIHLQKTAGLIAVALTAGAHLAGAGRGRLAGLQAAGLALGLAFQGADDLLDVTGTTAQLGKTAGKDGAVEKATWVRLEGLAAARQRTARYGRRGERLLQGSLPAGPERERLLQLAGRMWRRER